MDWTDQEVMQELEEASSVPAAELPPQASYLPARHPLHVASSMRTDRSPLIITSPRNPLRQLAILELPNLVVFPGDTVPLRFPKKGAWCRSLSQQITQARLHPSYQNQVIQFGILTKQSVSASRSSFAAAAVATATGQGGGARGGLGGGGFAAAETAEDAASSLLAFGAAAIFANLQASASSSSSSSSSSSPLTPGQREQRQRQRRNIVSQQRLSWNRRAIGPSLLSRFSQRLLRDLELWDENSNSDNNGNGTNSNNNNNNNNQRMMTINLLDPNDGDPVSSNQQQQLPQLQQPNVNDQEVPPLRSLASALQEEEEDGVVAMHGASDSRNEEQEQQEHAQHDDNTYQDNDDQSSSSPPALIPRQDIWSDSSSTGSRDSEHRRASAVQAVLNDDIRAPEQMDEQQLENDSDDNMGVHQDVDSVMDRNYHDLQQQQQQPGPHPRLDSSSSDSYSSADDGDDDDYDWMDTDTTQLLGVNPPFWGARFWAGATATTTTTSTENIQHPRNRIPSNDDPLVGRIGTIVTVLYTHGDDAMSHFLQQQQQQQLRTNNNNARNESSRTIVDHRPVGGSSQVWQQQNDQELVVTVVGTRRFRIVRAWTTADDDSLNARRGQATTRFFSSSSSSSSSFGVNNNHHNNNNNNNEVKLYLVEEFTEDEMILPALLPLPRIMSASTNDNNHNNKGGTNHHDNLVIQSLAEQTPLPAFVWRKLWPGHLVTQIQQAMERIPSYKGLLQAMHNYSSTGTTTGSSNNSSNNNRDELLQHPLQFSYWLSSNMTLRQEEKLLLLAIMSPIERLQWILDKILLTEQAESVIQCKRCGCPITRASTAFTVGGAQGTTGNYVNEYGHVHQTLTVREIDEDEVRFSGRAETRDSWFPGYSWTVMSCAFCYLHLGWKFRLAPDPNNGGRIPAETEDRPRFFYGLSTGQVATIVPEHQRARRRRPLSRGFRH